MRAPLDPLLTSTSPESSTLSRSVSGPNLNLGGDWGGELRDMERGGEFLNLWVGGVVDGLGGFVSSSCLYKFNIINVESSFLHHPVNKH